MTPDQQLDRRVQVRPIVSRVPATIAISACPTLFGTEAIYISASVFGKEECERVDTVDEDSTLEAVEYVVPVERQEIERMRSCLGKMLERIAGMSLC